MKVIVELNDDEAMAIGRVIGLANLSDTGTRGGPGTHGLLGFEKLTKMLLEDVALVVRRSGSWEADHMRQILTSHGYEV